MPRLKVRAGDSTDDVYAAVVDWAEAQGLELYPHQDEAILEVLSGANVVLATPTGSGKSLVATAAHAAALARDQVTYYTAPIKALVSEKFFDLCAVFGTDDVGMLTGDASVNADAPVICCTAEILANIALREGSSRRRRAGRHGRVPLLRRAGPRLGLAGAADRADAGPDGPDVGHPGRRHRAGRRPDPAHRPRDGHRDQRRAAGPAHLHLGAHPAGRDAGATGDDPPGAGVRRPLHSEGRGRAGHLAAEGVLPPQARPRAGRAAGRGPLHRRVRQDAVPAAQEGHRRPPRGDAAALPPARGAAGPGRAAQRHLRHRHPRGRHQRADPHRAVHRAGQVRRPAAADPADARVPPDRRPGRARGLRHGRVRRGAGARARHREREGQGQVGGQEPRQPQASGPSPTCASRRTAPSSGPSRPTTSWSPAYPSHWSPACASTTR